MQARALILLCTLPLAAHAQVKPTSLTPEQQHKLLDKARHAYYNVHTAGASGEIACQAVITWDNHWASQDKSLPKSPHGEQISAALKTITFKVTLHADNSIEATPIDLPPLTDPKDNSYQQAVVARMTGALSVVMQGWARFEVRSAFEHPGVHSNVLDLGSRYAVIYSSSIAEENIDMGRDFLIANIRSRSANKETAATRTRFVPASGGYLLSGWETVLSGQMNLAVTADVAYTDVQGIHLPRTIVAAYKPSYPGAKVTIGFSDWKFHKV